MLCVPCITAAAWDGSEQELEAFLLGPWNQEKNVSISSHGYIHRKTFQYLSFRGSTYNVGWVHSGLSPWMVQNQLATYYQDCQGFLSSLIRRYDQWLGINITSVVATPREELLVTNIAYQ